MDKLTERYNATMAEHNKRQARNRRLDDEAKRSLRILQKEYAILTADKAKNTYVIHCKQWLAAQVIPETDNVDVQTRTQPRWQPNADAGDCGQRLAIHRTGRTGTETGTRRVRPNTNSQGALISRKNTDVWSGSEDNQEEQTSFSSKVTQHFSLSTLEMDL